MLKFLIFSFLIICSLNSVQSQSSTTSGIPRETTDSVQTTVSSSPPETPSTGVPTTSSEQPETTKIVPPVTTSTEITTVTKEHTTTSLPTSPKPTEVPKPEKGKWTVTENNITCIRAEMAVQFKIALADPPMVINLSPNASSEQSTCNTTDGEQALVLAEESGPSSYVLVFIFAKDKDTTYVKNISFSFPEQDGKQIEVKTSGKFFTVNNGRSYLCNSDSPVTFENVTMTVSSVHLQAYGAKGNTGYTLAEECDKDDNVSDIVPIAVGCALAGLVVVILIAYLVGRRQSRQKGYQSV